MKPNPDPHYMDDDALNYIVHNIVYGNTHAFNGNADRITHMLCTIPKHHGNPEVPPGYMSFQTTYLLVLLHKLGVRPT